MAKILTTNKQFRLNIDDKIKKIILETQNQIAPRIEAIVKRNLKEHFDNNDTILSILGEKYGGRFSLQQEFGLTEEEALSAAIYIVDAIVDSVSIIFTQGNKQTTWLSGWLDYLTGSQPQSQALIKIIIAPQSFQLALSKKFGYVSDKSSSFIPWLSWLLTQGGRVVISGFSVGPSGSFASRAGGVLMRKKGVYRVDALHSGTIGDNFITRGIKEIIPKTALEIQQVVRSL